MKGNNYYNVAKVAYNRNIDMTVCKTKFNTKNFKRRFAELMKFKL